MKQALSSRGWSSTEKRLFRFRDVGRVSLFLSILLVGCGFEQVFAEEKGSSCNDASQVAPQATFENTDKETEILGRKIIAITAERFEKITGVHVGKLPVTVRFAEEIVFGDASRVSSGKVQGVTLYDRDSCTIQIAKKRISTFGRVLAHEVTHVFVREAFGQALNRTLNEGLAEYMAAQEFPSEVERDMRNAAAKGFVPQGLRTYVDGHRFCKSFAEDANFAAFFAREIKKSTHTDFSELKEVWEGQVSK